MKGYNHDVDIAFIRQRIADLKSQKSVTGYEMSAALGQGRNYVNNIIKGRSLPSLPQLLSICDYFRIAPTDFFDTAINDPVLLQIIDDIRNLDDNGLQAVIGLLQMLKNGANPVFVRT
jgi:transcriptional regulator with XRE-family HTH domain